MGELDPCSLKDVIIYQGNSTPSATLPHTWDGDELQDLHVDSFRDLILISLYTLNAAFGIT